MPYPQYSNLPLPPDHATLGPGQPRELNPTPVGKKSQWQYQELSRDNIVVVVIRWRSYLGKSLRWETPDPSF